MTEERSCLNCRFQEKRRINYTQLHGSWCTKLRLWNHPPEELNLSQEEGFKHLANECPFYLSEEEQIND